MHKRVKIVRVDLDNNEKPPNLSLHNNTVHINPYSTKQACVAYLPSKISKEMEEKDFGLVRSFGLVIYSQDNTRCNLILSHSLLLTARAKACPQTLLRQPLPWS